MSEFTCDYCDKPFTSEPNLYRHVKSQHLNIANSVSFKCDCCDYTTTRKDTLKRHRNKVHEKVNENPTPSKKLKLDHVLCAICESSFENKARVVDHYTSYHDISISNNLLKFSSRSEFDLWKSKQQKEQLCEFVQERGPCYKGDGTAFLYFNCHRSGIYKPKCKFRHQKVLGSNKIGGYCPASMNAIQSDDGAIKVKYCSTHVGHSNDLGRLRLSEEERSQLAQKIALKIPFDSILDSVRNVVSQDNLERIDLLTKKDLHNIASAYNLKAEAMLHRSDPVSVDSWVKELGKFDFFFNC